jgi:hypothetical protein
MKTKIDQSESESETMQCWGINSETPALRVELSDGSFHLFPYSLLIEAQFSPMERNDSLILAFDSHSIRITGTNLKKLGLAFQQLHVEWIKEIAGNPALTDSVKATIIKSIHISSEQAANPTEAMR